MVNKNVIVIGALGQDGSFLCELLLENGYNVYGVIKKDSDKSRFIDLVVYIDMDIENSNNLDELFNDINPIHIYNLMGVTNVFNPWEDVGDVYYSNLMTPIKLIESIRRVNQNIRFLQASSALVFGLSNCSPQNESTPRAPLYHYGLAKNFIDGLIDMYRQRYGMFLCSAILYNHESERRGDNFITKKITNGLVKISSDIKNNIIFESLKVGNIYAKRDWGYAKDYVIGMYKILTNEYPSDFILSTSELHSVKDFINETCKHLNILINWVGDGLNEQCLDVNTGKIIVEIDECFYRPIDEFALVGDNSKAKLLLDWEPKVNFSELVKIIINK